MLRFSYYDGNFPTCIPGEVLCLTEPDWGRAGRRRRTSISGTREVSLTGILSFNPEKHLARREGSITTILKVRT